MYQSNVNVSVMPLSSSNQEELVTQKTTYPLLLNYVHSYTMDTRPLIPILPVIALKPVLKLVKLLCCTLYYITLKYLQQLSECYVKT